MGERQRGGMEMERSAKGGTSEASRKQSVTMKQKLSGLKVWQLILLLLVVVGGTVLFVGVVSGWFGLGGGKLVLDAEYYCGEECDGELMELSGAGYEELVRDGGSFVVFVDQGGCTTADKLRGYVLDWANGAGVKVYKMMFSEMKGTSLYDFVKYYPSVAIVAKGRVMGYLRADSDEDADMYNDYDAFAKWMRRYL